jgi:hypothetical protein
MYRLEQSTPDMALRYQRATSARDAAIARDLNTLLRQRESKQRAGGTSRTRSRTSEKPAAQDPLPGF